MSEAIRESLTENKPEMEVLPQSTPQLPMKWHGFLAKFYLWLAAAYHIFQAIWVFTGKIYIESAARDAIYTSMPNMRFLDWGFAAVLALAAVLQILSASALIRKHKAGIRLLKGAYILLTLGILAYLIGRMLVSGMPPVSLSLIGQAISCASLLWVNHSYYGKRRNMFES